MTFYPHDINLFDTWERKLPRVNIRNMDKKQTLGGRIPPQDLDAEKALLGSIMLSPDSLHDITDIVSAETFTRKKTDWFMKICSNLPTSVNLLT